MNSNDSELPRFRLSHIVAITGTLDALDANHILNRGH